MSNFSGWQTPASSTIYPFKEGSSLRASSGWQLPMGAILDANVLPLGNGQVWLSSLSRTLGGVIGTIEGEDSILGTFTVTPEGGTCEVLSSEGTSRGTVLCAPDIRWRMLEAIEEFEPESSFFEEVVCFRYPTETVSNLSVNDLPARSGRIYLVEGTGVQFVPAEGLDDEFRVDLIGEPDLSEQGCPPVGTPLLQINDMVADGNGNVDLLVAQYAAPATETSLRQLLRVIPISNGLKISLAS